MNDNEISLRDKFAMASLSGDLAHYFIDTHATIEDCMGRAKLYYTIADAMLREREK
jgi:hypothetical protein